MSVFSVTNGRYTEWGPDVWAAMRALEPIPAPPPDESVEDIDNDPVPDEPDEEGEPE